MKRRNDEAILQEQFCYWLNNKGLLYTASMVGVFLPIRYAVMRKRMGVKSGVPDILIFEPHGKYHGLFIELKSPTGKSTLEQITWQKELTKRGYLSLIMPALSDFNIAFNWLRDTVENYLSTHKQEER